MALKLRAVGGRLESRLRFSTSGDIIDTLSPSQRSRLIAAGLHMSEVRDRHPGMSLAKLYDPTAMPTDLIDAHQALDVVMDRAFGLTGEVTLADRQKLLFRRYVDINGERVPRLKELE